MIRHVFTGAEGLSVPVILREQPCSAQATQIFSPPRHLRALHALLECPMPRADLDAITGITDSPELAAQQGRTELTVPCAHRHFRDQDGEPIYMGIYSLTDLDGRKLGQWQFSTGDTI
jgi:hypothetical protein